MTRELSQKGGRIAARRAVRSQELEVDGMGVLGWLRGSRSAPAASGRVLPPDEFTRFDEQPIFRCCMCGAGLGSDPDDSLHAEGPNRHLCGNCYRSREWDAIEEHEYFERDR